MLTAPRKRSAHTIGAFIGLVADASLFGAACLYLAAAVVEALRIGRLLL